MKQIFTLLLLATSSVFSIKAQIIPITLDLSTKNDMNITENSGVYTINTTGGDPNISSNDILTSYDKSVVFYLSFDYITPAGLDDVEIFFGPPKWTPAQSAQGGALPVTSVYKTYTLDMRPATGWASTFAPSGFPNFRFDLGRSTGQQITIKNIRLSATVPALPITLSSFTGVIDNHAIKLDWATASEKNNNMFTILRSGEDKVFTQIGNVSGAGNSDSKKLYVFKDVTPLSGNNYYKLLQTDFNGDSEEFGPVVVSTSFSDQNFDIYASGNEVKITLSSLISSKASVKVFDMNGSQIADQSVNVEKGFNNIYIAVADFKSGIYILSLTSDGKTVRKKFIK